MRRWVNFYRKVKENYEKKNNKKIVSISKCSIEDFTIILKCSEMQRVENGILKKLMSWNEIETRWKMKLKRNGKEDLQKEISKILKQKSIDCPLIAHSLGRFHPKISNPQNQIGKFGCKNDLCVLALKAHINCRIYFPRLINSLHPHSVEHKNSSLEAWE